LVGVVFAEDQVFCADGIEAARTQRFEDMNQEIRLCDSDLVVALDIKYEVGET
jgi:hypothetical protein